MQDFKDKKIVLGVSGGIAAYKSAFLVRELLLLGAQVRVVMTASATQFISELTFQALSGNAVRTAIFDTEAERAMGHIELARWADYLLIAPASANCLAKMAQGIADDLLSTLYLVAEVPVILCPAMNKSMYSHPATLSNCSILKQRGVIILEPAEGSQACGEFGLGRLPELDAIINSLRFHSLNKRLAGRKVLLTAGPTREAIDPVRFLSNQSSGKMGYALAIAAERAGAQVTLISGPVALTAPQGVNVLRVDSALAMQEAILAHLEPEILFIGTAAVADYRLTNPSSEKIKKDRKDTLVLTLQKNPDILSSVVSYGKAALVVGFAAETDAVLDNARKKLEKKKVDILIANQVGEGQGFSSDFNQVTLLSQKQEIPFPLMSKLRLAGELIAFFATILQNDAQKIV